MFGKASVLLVIGFGVVFGTYQVRLSQMTARAADTFNLHYMRALLHEAATSGMNVGVNEVWANDTDSADYVIHTGPCTTEVAIRPIGLDTIRVSVAARTDVIVDDYYADHNAPMPVQDSVFAIFTYETPVSRWFWFTDSERNASGSKVYWTSNDTVNGPMHTNNVLYTYGSPTFFGKVTARRGISPDPRWSSANFLDGWEVGIDASVPTDMSRIVDAANLDGASINQKARYDTELWLEFLGDGTVRRAIQSSVSWPGNPADYDTVSLATIAPNGVITGSEDIHIKGTINGQLTLYASNPSRDVFIDDDILCNDDPLTDPYADDFLGIVSSRDIIVSRENDNDNGCEIHASMLAINGSFRAQDYSTRPAAANPLKVVGSIVQHYRGAVGTFSWWGISSGFRKKYSFDPRLHHSSPPQYPYIRELRLASWWE